MEPSNPIIDEVRAAREALARESGDDMEKIVEAAKDAVSLIKPLRVA
jgi:hypothetical protein